MARDAFTDLSMESGQRKIRLFVVESALVPPQECEGFTLVVGMATDALALVAVEPAVLPDAFGQFVVASETLGVHHALSGSVA